METEAVLKTMKGTGMKELYVKILEPPCFNCKAHFKMTRSVEIFLNHRHEPGHKGTLFYSNSSLPFFQNALEQIQGILSSSERFVIYTLICVNLTDFFKRSKYKNKEEVFKTAIC